MCTGSIRNRAVAGGLQRHKVKALVGAATPAGAVTENTPHEPVTADYSISADQSQAKGVSGMGSIEIIYNGYIEEREGIGTAETNEAADNFMGMILTERDIKKLMEAEEKRLGVHSQEFMERHTEIMKTVDRIRRENKKCLCQDRDLAAGNL